LPSSKSNQSGHPIALRPVTADDAALLLTWRNHPELIRWSSSQRTVTPTEHQLWFQNLLRSHTAFIIMLAKQSIGHLRFEFKPGGKAIVSIYLDPAQCGHGYGTEALRKACAYIAENRLASEVIACVRTDNLRAQSSFMKAGFAETAGKSCPPGHKMLIWRPRNYR
jgi:RimJ/RimL family protein N-acetyltransferase